MIIAITGITGNMGQGVLDALKDVKNVTKVKLLCRNVKRMKRLLKKHKSLQKKCELIYGDMTNSEALANLVKDSEIVINLAAVIPPKSDRNPQNAIKCNDIGVKNLVSEIEKITMNQPSLIHISTVALYGNRSGAHKFIQVGDPLLPSVFDAYSVTKMRGEWTVLESNIKNWVVLRQTAMLHSNMFADNLDSGLLFHTVLDCSIEWVTAHDSGVLIANIIQAYIDNKIETSFWKHCYNISGGKRNRNYGMQTFDNGFSVLGGTTEDFFQPGDIIPRNFHCGWFSDADVLEDMFHYQSQTVDEFWKAMFKAHPVYKLGKLAPKSLIRKFIFGKLKKDEIAPHYWAKHKDIARLTAFFGGKEQYDRLQNVTWQSYPKPNYSEAQVLKENDVPIDYGFNMNKPDSQLEQADLESFASAHGGKFHGKYNGDIYEKLSWETQDGEIFTASAYTLLRAGHWYNVLYKEFIWDFDRLSKKDKVFASIWYDSHDKDENQRYRFDENWGTYVEQFAGSDSE